MRTLLRKLPERQYLQFPRGWTPNPWEAFDFESMRLAMEFIEQTSYRNLELAFVFDHPRRLDTVRVDALEGLEQ